MKKIVACSLIAILFIFSLTLISGCGGRETISYPEGKGGESL